MRACGSFGGTDGTVSLGSSNSGSISVTTPAHADRQASDAGATSIFPVVHQPYGERSGGVTDPFGNQWFIATPK